jgi:hypothetical protein
MGTEIKTCNVWSQTSRQGLEPKFQDTLLCIGYIQSTADECIYIRKSGDEIQVISVYVDDLGLFENSVEGMTRVKEELRDNFPITDLGKMTKILGMRVERDREQGTLKISQAAYIDIILARFNMQDAKPVSTPLNRNTKLIVPTRSKHTPTIDAPYAKAIGSLMYEALGTRPDIAFAIQPLSQFTTSYGNEHWMAIKHVLHYLKSAHDNGITFKKGTGLDLEIYVDSDYANRADAHSIGGYAAMIGTGCVA